MKRVLVLGGGFGGIATAHRLSKNLERRWKSFLWIAVRTSWLDSAKAGR